MRDPRVGDQPHFKIIAGSVNVFLPISTTDEEGEVLLPKLEEIVEAGLMGAKTALEELFPQAAIEWEL